MALSSSSRSPSIVALALSLLLAAAFLPSSSASATEEISTHVSSLKSFGHRQPAGTGNEVDTTEDATDDEAADEALPGTKPLVAEAPPAEAVPPASVATAAMHSARSAANTAAVAADVATRVAAHSSKVVQSAQSALKYARGVLRDSRVESDLTEEQEEALKKADAKLKEATPKQDYTVSASGVTTSDQTKLEAKMESLSDSIQRKSDLAQMREDLCSMRKELAKCGDTDAVKAMDAEMSELETMIKKLEAKDDRLKSHDELKAEIERLRDAIKNLEAGEGRLSVKMPKQTPAPPVEEAEFEYKIPTKYNKVLPLRTLKPKSKKPKAAPLEEADEEAEVDAKPASMPMPGGTQIDIDTEMPYGGLEPFGREDTAQELTEGSVRESNAMVDQLERAEVSEEKRAVFRALTRLRGAAITSFDGVARSQTGNIDEYNKVHKWRNAHPLHHLADEESDVSKWAFPDNADFIQVTKNGRATVSSEQEW